MVTAYVRVHGERYGIEICDDDWIRLVHPRWSIVGCGQTLSDAQADVLREAKALGVSMADMDPAKLSHEARKMRDYALGFVGTNGLSDHEVRP